MVFGVFELVLDALIFQAYSYVRGFDTNALIFKNILYYEITQNIFSKVFENIFSSHFTIFIGKNYLEVMISHPLYHSSYCSEKLLKSIYLYTRTYYSDIFA